MLNRHIAICGLPGSTLGGEGRGRVIEHKMCFDFLCNLCLKHFSFYEELSKI
jgi:hypothetical protein